MLPCQQNHLRRSRGSATSTAGSGQRGEVFLVGRRRTQALGHVGQDGEAHRDVEPVEEMLGVGVEVQGQVADIVAGGGDGGVGDHPLGDEEVEQAPFGFGVVGLHAPEALGRPLDGGGPPGVSTFEPSVAP